MQKSGVFFEIRSDVQSSENEEYTFLYAKDELMQENDWVSETKGETKMNSYPLFRSKSCGISNTVKWVRGGKSEEEKKNNIQNGEKNKRKLIIVNIFTTCRK